MALRKSWWQRYFQSADAPLLLDKKKKIHDGHIGQKIPTEISANLKYKNCLIQMILALEVSFFFFYWTNNIEEHFLPNIFNRKLVILDLV